MTLPGITSSRPADTPTLAELEPDVRSALRVCAEITRKHARNFYYGLRLTPEPRRSAVYAIYALMRACDDLADDAAATDVPERRARIEAFRIKTHEVFADPSDRIDDEPVWRAFRHVVRHHPVQVEHIDAMLDGQLADLTTTRYETFDELYGYCYNVASVVGLICVAIWGHDGDLQINKLAEYRGIAFQLTNILRDQAEDANRGRIYLPMEDLRRFAVNPQDLHQGVSTPEFERMMVFQIERARTHYAMSASLESHLAPDCRSTSWAMARIYRGILDRIAADPGRVLRSRVRLGNFEKLSIAARAHLWHAIRG
ncbi:MAG: phytoene/squalene synthase family protein [Phycisphaeraceae bacterium]